VIGLYEAGVENAVATMGTAFTEEHCAELKSTVRRVVTVFDPDRAGADAWHRSVHVFLASGIFAKDLSLPDGKDPDEFVLSEGAEKFYALCERAPRQITKMLKEIAAKGALSEQERAKVLSELTPILIASRRLPERALLWDDISLLLNVSVASLKELSSDVRPPLAKTNTPATPAQPAKPRPMVEKPPHPLALQFFKACLDWPAEFLKLPPEVWRGGIEEPKIANALERLSQARDLAGIQAGLEEILRGESEGWLASIASAGLFENPNPEPITVFQALVERVRSKQKEREIRQLTAEVRLAQRLGDQEELLRLMSRLRDLRITPSAP
jgi:DNA primase